MNEKLAKLLGLKPDATEDQILSAVKALAENAAEAKLISLSEAAITKKIVESGHALTREQAKLSIQNQAEYDAAQKAKSKAKK